MSGLGKGLSVSGLIVFGTINSLFAKIVYEVQSKGLNGEVKPFRKPWAMTSVMFLGMIWCLPIAYIMDARNKTKGTDETQEPLLTDAEANRELAAKPSSTKFKETLMLAIPTVFDLIATILMNIGLLYVTASVYQMLRGAEMLFAAVFAVVFLHRKLNRFHIYGILCCVVGICLVGLSSVLANRETGADEGKAVSEEAILIGMALIVVSQAVQAAQITFEDFFMADMDIPAMKIVGYEGFFGAIGTLGIMAPIAYYLPGVEGEGIHEDIWDTWAMVVNSRTLQLILVMMMVALLLYNVTGMMVTSHLGAVFRTVLETMRTIFVWIVDLLLFYTAIGGGTLGEEWTRFSWIQAVGFLVLVAGTLVYRQGDSEVERHELAEALAMEAAVEPVAAEPGVQQQHAAPGRSVAVRMPSQPMDVAHPPSSFRATQTITSGSYRGNSLPRSLTGNSSALHRDSRG